MRFAAKRARNCVWVRAYMNLFDRFYFVIGGPEYPQANQAAFIFANVARICARRKARR